MSTYSDVRASLFNFCKGYVDGLSDNSVEVFDFDSNTQESTWKVDKTLIGVSELTMTNLGEMHIGTCSIACATLNNDINSDDLVNHIGTLYDLLKPNSILGKWKNGITGAEIGNITLKEVSIIPYGKTNTRPLQEIAIAFAIARFPTP